MANFAWALEQLQNNKAVKRAFWDFLDRSKTHLKEVTFKGFAPCLVQYNTFPDGTVDKYPGAVIDYEEMIAGDWEFA